ncbi:MAG: ATP-binding protein [Gemmiger sp.]
MRRKTVSGEFFSIMATVLLLGLAVMCLTQTALSTAYFAEQNRDSLNGVLNGAVALGEIYAGEGSVVTSGELAGAEKNRVESALAIFNTATDTVVYVADPSGRVVLSTGDGEVIEGSYVPADVLKEVAADPDFFAKSTLDGLYTQRYYTVGRKVEFAGKTGYIFAASCMGGLSSYVGDMTSMFVLSAGLMLLVCSALSLVFARRITRPIEDISRAARQLGSGDFTARAPVGGCEELAEFATTFNNMAARLQTIDNSRGQFMGNIAHELRTPMTSIKGFIDGMLDGTIPPEDHQHYLEIVSGETGRLARLVQNMLDITRLEAGEYKVSARDYDLWETLTDVVLTDEQRIEDGKIDIQGLAPDHMLVHADPDLVHQVVYNIVDNAIKFTPPGGVIRFAVRQEDGMVETSIENTGAGIAADALPYVFDRFYKEDRSRGLNTRGSGLGLHICKVLITLSGGQIKVESEEGQWCRFTFTLPAAK